MEDELKVEIRKLTNALKVSNSFWHSFIKSIINGFGFFIGSAILVAALLYILSHIEGWAYIGRYAHNIMEVMRQGPKK